MKQFKHLQFIPAASGCEWQDVLQECPVVPLREGQKKVVIQSFPVQREEAFIGTGFTLITFQALDY